MTDNAVNIIIALLPLTAFMLVSQTSPYHALVIRGILGAVSALVYAVLGAADVALTEALVGTLLSVALYVVAVRSSLVMRLGIPTEHLPEARQNSVFKRLTADLGTVLSKYHVRLEIVPYSDSQTLNQALMAKEVHATCLQQFEADSSDAQGDTPQKPPYQLTVRVKRLYNIFQAELPPTAASLTYTYGSEAYTTDLAADGLGKVPS